MNHLKSLFNVFGDFFSSYWNWIKQPANLFFAFIVFSVVGLVFASGVPEFVHYLLVLPPVYFLSTEYISKEYIVMNGGTLFVLIILILIVLSFAKTGYSFILGGAFSHLFDSLSWARKQILSRDFEIKDLKSKISKGESEV